MNNPKLKKAGEIICDFIEIKIPTICFCILFISYIFLIVYRYILHASVQWLNEVSWISYLWTAVFALSVGGRKGKDVAFTIVYDRCSPVVQKVFRILSNVIVIGLFGVTLPHVWEAIDFMSIKKTPIMHIPYNILYFPFLIFIVLSMIYCIKPLIADIISIFANDKGGNE